MCNCIEEQELDLLTQEMKRMKDCFPFRIVWGYIEDGKPVAQASFDRRQMNKVARTGKQVLIYSFK